jgi:hypothetical protein
MTDTNTEEVIDHIDCFHRETCWCIGEYDHCCEKCRNYVKSDNVRFVSNN